MMITLNGASGGRGIWVGVVLVALATMMSACVSPEPEPQLTDPIDVEALILAEQMADRAMVQEAHPGADVPLPATIDRIRVIDELGWAEVLAECRLHIPAATAA